MPLLNPDILTAIGRAGFGPRRPVEGPVAGQHRSPLHGLSPEFADFRSYAPGDDPRNLDWRAFARSDRLYIRRYEEESNLRSYLIVDSSRSMAYAAPASRRGAARPSKYYTAATIGVSLAAVSLGQRDAVGLMTVDREVDGKLSPSGATSQLPEIDRRLEAITPDGTTDLVAALRPQIDQIARRSLVVVISDWLTELDDLPQLIGQLRHRGCELLAIQVLDDDEIDLPFESSTLFVDIEGSEELFAEPWAFRAAYRDAMSAYCDQLRDEIKSAGYDFWQIRCGDPLPAALASRLHARAAQRV